MTQPDQPQYIPIIGYVDPDGDPVPRPVQGQSATSSTNPELHAKLMGVRRPWKRKIEMTVDEEVVAALRLFSEGYFKATGKRLGEEDAIRQLVVDGLVGMGDLKPR